MPTAVLALVVMLAVLPAPGAPLLRPPVPGPVVERFRPPACRWCPGNRGIDYAPPPGTPVLASGAGVVTVAGQVGGTLVVVVAHPDGLRTTYHGLTSVAVARGARVRQGAVVGTASGHLHFGVRRGDVYLDPEGLVGASARRPRLVPVEGRTD